MKLQDLRDGDKVMYRPGLICYNPRRGGYTEWEHGWRKGTFKTVKHGDRVIWVGISELHDWADYDFDDCQQDEGETLEFVAEEYVLEIKLMKA